MKDALVFFAVFMLLCGCTEIDDNHYFVRDVTNPVINLNGIWKINIDPKDSCWKIDEIDSTWKNIQVPGECMMQGFPIKHDKPFVYKKQIEIPADYEGKKTMLQFDGVYCYAKVWINGNYVSDHFGGFTRWYCNITPFVKPGETSTLTLEVTDRSDDISYASGYAKHQIGGILRDVYLLALPSNYPEDVKIVTDLDENYVNADLIVSGRLNEKVKNATIKLRLSDRNNKIIPLQNSEIILNGTDSFEITNLVKTPEKWDAEHPNLYSLKLSYYNDGKLLFRKIHRFGFREIEIRGNRLYVNGMETKLRGACRHDIHPLLGRVSTRDYELKDVTLAKEANINFIRTSHYPPTEHFLQLCDEFGLYVEDESAVCFVGTHRTKEYYPGNSENDTNFTARYLSQVQEIVLNHRNHPSIIMWSIGNECSFGINFRRSYDWIKANDNTRPVIFSYPGHVPDSIKSYDILSMHYPDLTGNMDQYGIKTEVFGYKRMPVIFDEWTHVSCYNSYTLKEDPGVRDFWGTGLDSMWQKTFRSDGGLGGAIWGFVDEIFMLPADLEGFGDWWGKFDKDIIPGEYAGPTVGYGEWGIIDVWRRKKPEFWNTKKAYSPVRIMKTSFENHEAGQAITVPVFNRFDHTSLSELKMTWSYKGVQKILSLPDINPHSGGEFTIPLDQWDPDEPILIDFFSKEELLIDSYSLQLNKLSDNKKDSIPEGKIELTENNNRVIIHCQNGIEFEINRETGLFTGFTAQDNHVIFSGPYLNYRILGKSLKYSLHIMDQYGTDWILKSLDISEKDNQVIVSAKGDYSEFKNVEFVTQIFGDGSILTGYSIYKGPDGLIRELGLRFLLGEVFDSVSWKRIPYWSFYPDGHLSADKGKVALYPVITNKYRKVPEKSWELDSKSFYYNGISDESGQELTFIAKSTKENILQYDLQSGKNIIISVRPVNNISCRLAKNKDLLELFINDQLDYPDLSWGNYQRNIEAGEKHSGKVGLIIHF